MGAFDDITSRYGSNANSGNALKIMPNTLLMALRIILNGLTKQAKKSMTM